MLHLNINKYQGVPEQAKGKADHLPAAGDSLVERTKAAYDIDPDRYCAYADGEGLYDFLWRRYGYADRKLWQMICELIDREIRRGKRTLRILDIACGPGTWLLRLFDTYLSKGIAIHAVGIDVAPGMLTVARKRFAAYRDAHQDVSLDVSFVQGDASLPLSFADGEFDISLNLYTCLNHLPPARLPLAVREMLRVTTRFNVTTVRCKGGLATAYICAMEDVRDWKQVGDLVSFTDRDGKQHVLPSHLFSSDELRHLFEAAGEVRDLFGLDFLFSRAMDQRAVKDSLPGDEEVFEYLPTLENELCRRTAFIDISNHAVVVAVPRLGV